MTGTRFACSWSGGKDSCLALHLMAAAGAQPAALLTVFDDAGERSRSHGLAPSILQAQAKSLDLPLHTARASWQDYEREFLAALHRLAADGVRDVVFGDIDLDEHRAWEERVCAAAGVTAHLPLWRAKRREVLDELWRSGHRCHVVAVDAQKLGRDVLGQELTPELADRLESLGVDACGENGEFHTVVYDGPRFRYPLRLRFGEVVENGGYLAIDCACEP
ncbi:MAG: diphthine--ammonia ligase [Planctomycetota bacterium]